MPIARIEVPKDSFKDDPRVPAEGFVARVDIPRDRASDEGYVMQIINDYIDSRYGKPPEPIKPQVADVTKPVTYSGGAGTRKVLLPEKEQNPVIRGLLPPPDEERGFVGGLKRGVMALRPDNLVMGALESRARMHGYRPEGEELGESAVRAIPGSSTVGRAAVGDVSGIAGEMAPMGAAAILGASPKIRGAVTGPFKGIAENPPEFNRYGAGGLFGAGLAQIMGHHWYAGATAGGALAALPELLKAGAKGFRENTANKPWVDPRLSSRGPFRAEPVDEYALPKSAPGYAPDQNIYQRPRQIAPTPPESAFNAETFPFRTNGAIPMEHPISPNPPGEFFQYPESYPQGTAPEWAQPQAPRALGPATPPPPRVFNMPPAGTDAVVGRQMPRALPPPEAIPMPEAQGVPPQKLLPMGGSNPHGRVIDLAPTLRETGMAHEAPATPSRTVQPPVKAKAPEPIAEPVKPVEPPVEEPQKHISEEEFKQVMKDSLQPEEQPTEAPKAEEPRHPAVQRVIDLIQNAIKQVDDEEAAPQATPPIEQPPTKPKVETPKEPAPKEEPNVIPQAPTKKLTNSELQNFAYRRKQFSVDDLQRQFGVSAEEAKEAIQRGIETEAIHRSGGVYKEGRAPEETGPAKSRPVKPPVKEQPKVEPPKSETPAEEPTGPKYTPVAKKTTPAEIQSRRMARLQMKEELTDAEARELADYVKKGVKPDESILGEEAKTEVTKSEPVAEAPKDEFTKTLSSVEPSWTPEKEISHDHLYKAAKELGVQPTPLARRLIEAGYKVQPSKFPGLYGTRRVTKGSLTEGK